MFWIVMQSQDGDIVGHLPRKISKVCSLFLRRGGSISCEMLIATSARESSTLYTSWPRGYRTNNSTCQKFGWHKIFTDYIFAILSIREIKIRAKKTGSTVLILSLKLSRHQVSRFKMEISFRYRCRRSLHPILVNIKQPSLALHFFSIVEGMIKIIINDRTLHNPPCVQSLLCLTCPRCPACDLCSKLLCTMAGLYFKGTAHGCIEPIALKVMWFPVEYSLYTMAS